MVALADPALQFLDLNVQGGHLGIVELVEESLEHMLVLVDEVRLESVAYRELILDSGKDVAAGGIDESLGRLRGELLVLLQALQNVDLETQLAAVDRVDLLL